MASRFAGYDTGSTAVGNMDYPEIRKCLAPQYQHLPTEYIEQIIEAGFGEGVTPDDIEGIFDDIGSFVKKAGKTVAGVLPSVLPVAGTVVGTAFGGPLGGALGGVLGSAAGSAVGAATGRHASVSSVAKSALAGGLQAAGSAIGGGGQAAAAGQSASKLLQTVLNPKVIQSLQSMAMGQAGKTSIPVGGKQVPLSAFANLIGSLANQAMAEQHAIRMGAESAPLYLLNSEGLPIVDPAVPEQRAAVLLNLLQQESWDEAVSARSHNSFKGYGEQEDQEDLDEYYDQLELASLHEDALLWERY